MSQFHRATYLLTSIILTAFVTGQVWNPAKPKSSEAVAVSVPDVVGDYRSNGDVRLPEKTRAELGASHFIARTYSNKKDIASQFDFVVLTGTDRTALHDPRGCMVGAGWAVQNDRTETLPGTNAPVRACDMVGLEDVVGQKSGFGTPDKVARKGISYEVLYVYLVDGKLVQGVTQIRGQMLLSALVGQQNRPVYYTVFMRSHRDDPQRDRQEGERLRQFAGTMWEALNLQKGGADVSPSVK